MRLFYTLLVITIFDGCGRLFVLASEMSIIAAVVNEQ